MNIAITVVYIFPIMLASCLMLWMTHYAQNFAGIIGVALTMDRMQWFFRLIRIRLITGWIRNVVTDNTVADLLNLPIKSRCLFNHFNIFRSWCHWYFRILTLFLSTVTEKYGIGWVWFCASFPTTGNVHLFRHIQGHNCSFHMPRNTII